MPAKSPETTKTVAPWTHLLAICAASILLYSNTLGAPFVFDDITNITGNPYARVAALDFGALKLAAFESRAPRPLANLSFALNHVACGYDVSCYRIVNILIHMANGLLVYSLATFLFVRLRPGSRASAQGLSLLAALVFVAHPIQIQSVTYVVQRMTSMATLFYLLGLLAYLRGRIRAAGSAGWPWWAATACCGVLGFGSKQIAATLPLALLLVEWLFMQDASWRWLRDRLRPFAALFGVATLLGVAYLWTLDFPGYADRDFTMGERVLTQLRVVPFYLSLLLLPLPARLNLIHVFEPSTSLFDPISTVFGAVFLLGLAALGVATARRERLLSFAILWFFLHLLLESSVLPLELAYEHRLYLPMFGFSLFVADGVYRLASERRVRAICAGGILVAALGLGTWVRNGVWGDAITLWSDVLEKSPLEERANNNFAHAMRRVGRIDEVIARLEEVIALYPDDAKVRHSLGLAYDSADQDGRALQAFVEASRLDRSEPLYRMKVGLLLVRQGDLAGGMKVMEDLVREHPLYAKGHFALGSVFESERRSADAQPHYIEGLRHNPDSKMIHVRRAKFLFGERQLEAGLAHLYEAQRLDPHDRDLLDTIERVEKSLAGG